MRTISVNGTEVVLRLVDGRREWMCPCEEFQQRNRRTRGGYCPHVPAAIIQCIREGSIRNGNCPDLPSELPVSATGIALGSRRAG